MTTAQPDSNVARLEGKIGYRFVRSELAEEALQAPGNYLIFISCALGFDGNKRLAVVGDAILDLILSEDWYKSDRNRERFTTIRNEVASNSNLDHVGRAHDIDHLVKKSPGATTVPLKVMTATVEGILGAVWLDSSSVDAVRQVMNALGLIPATVSQAT